ncbi:MAG: UDP-N-acetylmuramyl pentapeptide phosphotransferase/UDP-N-acetylglucosamine-phosphate transferase [Actinomycetia bacterium]|nr:UDP-N-acetylmuramyl pentapeptide phosphotransferase/UDP-N-acetylglucosamine-phosphate transferase [Actinomycetes bacterium]
MVALAVALAISLVCTPIAARAARRFGVVDHPGPLKVQQTPVPYLGGLAVFAAIAVAVAPQRPSLLWPLGLACALGLADDIRGLHARSRLLAEIAIGVVAGVVAPAPGPVGGVVTAVFLIGMVNAVNLLDGLDGLASGVALVSALGFAAISPDARALALPLAGALAGFLVYNRPPARIYLGDAGAYTLGAANALLAALALRDGDASTAWAAVPLLVALPVADTAIAIVRRWRARRPLFAGDRSHVYDQLVDRGLTPGRVALACAALQASLTLVGVLVVHLATPWAVALAATTVVALVLLATYGGFVSTAEVRS